MTLYGELDDRFRPRPSTGALAGASLCQILLAVWATHALVSTADMLMWRAQAKMEKGWIAYLPPWMTLKVEAARRGVIIDEPILPVAASLTVAALIALYFWPGRNTLSSRLFSVRFAQSVALFGGAAFSLRPITRTESLLPWAIVLAAMAIVALGEWRANNLLGALFDLRRPILRVGHWMVRVAPGCAVVAAMTYGAGYSSGVVAAAIFAGITLIANVVRSPTIRYETLEDPRMRASSAALAIVTVAVFAGAAWLFGFRPMRSPRAIVVSPSGTKVVEWSRLARELPLLVPPPQQGKPKIDIHWTTPQERARRKR